MNIEEPKAKNFEFNQSKVDVYDLNTNKCNLIVNHIEKSGVWELIFKSNERNGTGAYKRSNL